MQKYWIGVASKEHVDIGVSIGIAQFCHGKQGPAKRLKKDDIVIYYSPKLIFGEDMPCQQFTAIGIVQDDEPYQVEQAPGFNPFRRNIKYLPSQAVDIRPLIPNLLFIKNKVSWGMTFRYGFLEIDKESFEAIEKAMLDKNAVINSNR